MAQTIKAVQRKVALKVTVTYVLDRKYLTHESRH